MPSAVEAEFAFEPVPHYRYRWRVSCEGIDWAILTLHAPEGEWRLSGLGPLQGLLAAWEHDCSAVRDVPAAIRRDAVASLAMAGLSRLRRAHETLDRLAELASRTHGKEIDVSTGRAA